MARILTFDNKIITFDNKVIHRPVNPLTVSGMKSVYDARYIVPPADGTAQNQMTDHLGGLNPAQATGANQALFKVNQFGSTRPGFLFDGTNDNYVYSQTNISQNKAGLSLIALFKKTSSSSTGTIWATATNSSTARFSLVCSAGTVTIGARRLDADAANNVVVTLADANPHILYAVADYANGLMTVWLDGVQVGTGAFGSSGNSSNTASAFSTFGSFNNTSYFGGTIGALYYSDTALSPGTMQSLYTSLKTGFGI